MARCVSRSSVEVVPACNTSWTWWTAQRSGTFSCQHKMCGSLSIQRARYSSAVPCSITAKICKKADLRSRIPTPWLTVPAAKVLRFDNQQVSAAALLLFGLDFRHNILLHPLHSMHHRLHHLLHFIERILHHGRHLSSERLTGR